MAARAQQHGGVRFCRGHVSQRKTARRGLLSQSAPRGPPGHPRSPCGPGWLFFFAVVCASRAQRCDSWPLLGLSGRPARRVARSPTRARAQQHAGGLFCRAHFILMEAGFVNFELFFIG